MKHKLLYGISGLLALCVLASLPIATAFADGKTFTVTFYGGEYGVRSRCK